MTVSAKNIGGRGSSRRFTGDCLAEEATNGRILRRTNRKRSVIPANAGIQLLRESPEAHPGLNPERDTAGSPKSERRVFGLLDHALLARLELRGGHQWPGRREVGRERSC